MAKIRTLFLAFLATIARVIAQFSDVTECVPEWQWTINSLGQIPCLVAVYLGSSCSGVPHTIQALTPTGHYVGPENVPKADLCQCNSITYSLIEACSGCQNNTHFISFEDWTFNCPTTVTIGQFPTQFPVQVQVPSWAMLNISLTNNTFNQFAAEEEALRAGILPITSTSGVSSVASSTGPSTQSQSTSPPTAVPGSNEDSATNSGGLSPGGIVGIVIGVAVVAILLFIFWRMLLASRSRKAAHRAPQYDSVNPFSDKQDPLSPPGHIHSNLPNLASNVTPYMYNPSDVNRTPVSPESSMLYTASPVHNSLDDIISPQTGMVVPRPVHSTNGPANQRGYTGAPEV